MNELDNLMLWLRLFWKAEGTACVVRFRADGVREFDVLCQELPPAPVGYWFNGVALAEWKGSAGWRAVTDYRDLWSTQLDQVTENPPSLSGYPSGAVPRLEGRWVRGRLWVEAGADDREAAQMGQVRAVNRRVEALEKRVEELRDSPLPQTLVSVKVRSDPSAPTDAVNLRWLQKQVTEIHSWLAQATAPAPCPVDALEDRVTALEALAQEVQDLELLVRKTGARFVGPVFVPYAPGSAEPEDSEAVAWGVLKERLRQQRPGRVVIVE